MTLVGTASNGWTGGQYSLFRVIFGLWLFVSVAGFYDASGGWMWLVVEVLIIPFVLGFRDRGFGAAILGLFLFADRISTAYPSAIYPLALGASFWVLCVHVALPPAPYGTLDALGRPDPGNGWHIPDGLFRATWVLLSVLYAVDGTATLFGEFLQSVPGANLAVGAAVPQRSISTAVDGVAWAIAGLEIVFAALAFVGRLRVALWPVMLAVQLAMFPLFGLSPFAAGLILLQLLAFDPAWVAPRHGSTTDLVFYDGNCGLCHRAVRFILAEDRSGTAFRFAPLGGETFIAALSETQRASLPDSIAILASDGRLLTRSSAIVHILSELGGIWRLIGALASIVPTSLLDLAYDGVARIRYRLFARPKDACPIIPKHLRTRFDF